ncbi:MAG TPA: N-6 DNA methylase [Arenimonas sp.]
MTAAQHRKNLANLMRDTAHRWHLWDVYRDFLELAALSIANAILVDEAREQRYLACIARYTPDEAARFPKMLGELVMGLEAEPHDMLGMLFGELEQGNSAMGQFFTPFEVCRLMADLTVDGEMLDRINQRGFVTVQEPAVGAGAMIIAMATALSAKGVNYQQCMHVTAIDTDLRAVHMAYLQFSLLGIPATVVHGNTLTLQQHSVWHTPAHHLGLWDPKLRRGYLLGSAADDDCTPPLAPAPVTVVPATGQLDLFSFDRGVKHG